MGQAGRGRASPTHAALNAGKPAGLAEGSSVSSWEAHRAISQLNELLVQALVTGHIKPFPVILK